MYVSGWDLFGEDSVFANEGATLGVWDGGRADVCLCKGGREGGREVCGILGGRGCGRERGRGI